MVQEEAEGVEEAEGTKEEDRASIARLLTTWKRRIKRTRKMKETQ